MTKRIFTILILLFSLGFISRGQMGPWSGSVEYQGAKLSIVFHLDEEDSTMDSPDQGAKGIPVQVDRTAAGKLVVRIPSIAATFEGLWTGKSIVGTFKQSGLSFPLTLTPGEPRLNRPQTPRPPFPYAQEEVSFSNGDMVLNGTLVLPEGCTRETPALVMVTGSGLQNRDEEIFEHKPFAVIADALARAGVATLRYDDRGFDGSYPDIAGVTTDDFKDDALAGVRWLRERFDKVGVIGHSEGGTIAMMLAAEKQADFIVSLAGIAVSGAETLVWQNRVALLAAGLPNATVDAYCRLLERAFEAQADNDIAPQADGWDITDALKQNYQAVLAQIRTPYMRRFLTLDVRPSLGSVECPVLALNGTRDTQVDYECNLPALRDGLPANPLNRIEAVEGVNHLFQHCTTGLTAEYREIEETISPGVLDIIVQWVSFLK